MFGLWAILRSIRSEYFGWHKFREAAGVWPVYSILTDFLSAPLLFAGVVYCWVAAMGTGWLAFIYSELIFSGLFAALLWWGFRRLACKSDVARGLRSSARPCSAEALEEFIR
jgi:hypothetical protein